MWVELILFTLMMVVLGGSFYITKRLEGIAEVLKKIAEKIDL